MYLTTPVVGRNDYINAVFLSVSLAESFANILKHINIATCNFIHNEYIFCYQTYTEANALVITCSPLSHNVGDIWRMVHDHNVDAIVLMGSSGIPQVRGYIILYR